VFICREGLPFAVFTAVREDSDRGSDRLLELMAEGRFAAGGQTSKHDDFYDENGLPK
jgi:hypothetical protein